MKKEVLSIRIVKTLLAVIIFAGVGTIIIGGVWLIGMRGVVINDKPIEDRQTEEITLFTGCNDLLDFWTGLSSTEKTKECNKILDQRTVDLKTMGFVPEYCKVIKAEAEHCEPALGTRLACSYICEIVDRYCKELDEKECIENQKCEPNYVYSEDGEKQYVFCEEKNIKPDVSQVTIATDKMEYEQGETVEITVKNNLDEEICYPTYSGSDCWKLSFKVEKFSSDENKWVDVPVGKSLMCPQVKMPPSSKCSKEPVNFLWDQNQHNKGATSPGKYRIAFSHFPYEKQKLIETKEKTIGKIICEGENIPDELEELLVNGNWEMGNVSGCAMCEACGCSCTTKNVWAVDGISIDIHEVSCGGNSYTIKYKNKEYNCVPENYKPSFGCPSPPENWETIYSNEFTIKEKSALDPKCSEKVVGTGYCRAFREGYEFDSITGKCIKKGVSGCSFEIPFESLEECQEVCEKTENVNFSNEEELVRCENDSDCVLVDPGKCDCNNCKTKAINKKYLDAWSKNYVNQECHIEIICPAVAIICKSYKVKCDNNECIAEK